MFDAWAQPPIRMSPTFGAPLLVGARVEGEPLSETWAKLTLATFSHSAKASWIACSQLLGAELGVEGRVEVARGAAEVGAVGHDAPGDPAAVGEVVAGHGIEQHPILETLRRPGGRAPATGLARPTDRGCQRGSWVTRCQLNGGGLDAIGQAARRKAAIVTTRFARRTHQIAIVRERQLPAVGTIRPISPSNQTP